MYSCRYGFHKLYNRRQYSDDRYNNIHNKLLLYLHKNGTNQIVTLIAAIHSFVKRSGTIIIKKKK